MSTILGRFTKQSAEVRDYDVDFTDWFSNRTDTPLSVAVTAEAGITIVGTPAINNRTVKIILSGGTNGAKYKLTCRLTTSTGIVREVDFIVRVKDV